MADGLKVVVVDDEEGMREGIRRVMQKQGFSVDTAEDGETALKLLGSRPYDLAFVDLKMPGISGFQVTEFINEKIGNRTVVVIVSALATVEAAVEVTRHGAFDFLVKPFTPADLLRVTERAVKQCELIRDRESYLTELQHEKNLSRQLINAMQEGVMVFNIRRKPVLMNPRAEFYLQISFSPDLEAKEIFPQGEILASVEQILSVDRDRRKTVILRSETGGRMLQFRMHPLDLGGEPGGVILLIEDVTEEWKVEQDKNRFVSMVAHELKSPMAAIISYIDAINTGVFDDQVEKIHEILERCKIRGQALLELVGDLLYINKREAGKVRKTIERWDLAEVLKQQLEFYKQQAEMKKISLGLSSGDGPYEVEADRSDLDRIFMNLLSNGIKYNRDSGRLEVELSREDSSIVVKVEDTGFGMEEKDIENLFQEFYRIKNKFTSGISGTGLGLATVKRVLADYNGRINVGSQVGKGTTFTVYFPCAGS